MFDFTTKQLEQIKSHGADVNKVQEQINIFEQGLKFLDISKIAKINDGIQKLKNIKQDFYIEKYNEFSKNKNSKIIKFVPASGAASRMFKDLFLFYKDKDASFPEKNQFNVAFELVNNLQKFAFINDLESVLKKDNIELKNIISENTKIIFEYILTPKGLNYGKLPKALIKFHKYKNETRTSFEEHIVEGFLYALSQNNVNLHFTISNEHLKYFKNLEKNILPKYQKKAKVNIEYSFQEKSTDTLAVDITNKPFIDENDKLLFRPAGHGALINNLNKLKADLIFIKNIDNVVADDYKSDTITYKKLIAGILLEIQEQTFKILKNIDDNKIEIKKIEEFVNEKLQVIFPDDYFSKSEIDKVNFLKSKLNRPIRVCGMVINQGEPGGGPFWVKHFDNSIQLQIVEKSQININNEVQNKILNSSEYFNPVDLVVSTKTYKGDYFNLLDFIDNQTSFISEKSQNGRVLKALEIPGLWNGAMSNWNTIFVDVPISTFNPVKIVTDLLRGYHIPKI